MSLPRLRFEHGDLVIKLDRNPMRWLIIHRKVFAAVSPVFGASASGAWKEQAQLDTTKHPRTGKDVEVRTLALKRVQDTYILEGKDVALEADDASTIRAVPFSQSSLATGNAPDLTGSQARLANDEEDTTSPAPESARALHVFFALIYSTPLALKQHRGGEKCIIPYLLLDICAYADYYACFATLKPTLINTLLTRKKAFLHKDVAHNPQVYALLAKRLELEDVYNDALRHLVSNAYTDDLRESNSGDWGYHRGDHGAGSGRSPQYLPLAA